MAAKKQQVRENEDGTYDVYLRRSVGFRSADGGVDYKGPGPANLTAAQYETIKLSPSLVETDAQGNPLPHTVAASALGAGGTASTNSMPAPARDENGDIVDENDAAVGNDIVRRSALDDAQREINDYAGEDAERTGGTLAGETGELHEQRDTLPLPGQVEPSDAQVRDDERVQELARRGALGAPGFVPGGAAQGVGAQTGRVPGVESDEPLTKSELRGMDKAVLVDLARRNRVQVDDGATKQELVDALYDAQVKLD